MDRRSPPRLPDADPAYLEDLYARFLDDPLSVDPGLWGMFASWADERGTVRRGIARRLDPFGPPEDLVSEEALGHERLKVAWRTYGHLAASLDPLGLQAAPGHPELEPEAHGLPPETQIGDLRAAWGGSLTAEVMHLEDVTARDWLIGVMENGGFTDADDAARRDRLDQLIRAESVEAFMSKRFPTNKRFGLEGLEAYVPMLERMLAEFAGAGAEQVVIAPAHRGRLTVITEIAGKPWVTAFSELLGTPAVPEGVQASSDVPYHLGIKTTRRFGGTGLAIDFLAHPSHVELVSAVALGRTRAKQDLARQSGEADPEGRIVPLLMHTDGAFSGQGVISEMLQLGGLPAFGVGGAVHVIANNQLAFTVKPEHGRSSRYASDAAKAIGAPVLHVNADDVDAVVRAGRIAVAYRMRFRRDIVVDVVGYRRRGHNELEEPMFTEPKRYDRIASHLPSPKRYAAACVADGLITEDAVEAARRARFDALDAAYEAAKTHKPNAADRLTGRWSGMAPRGEGAAPDTGFPTGLPKEALVRLARASTDVPEGFRLNAKIARQWRERLVSIDEGAGIGFATAEALAFASVLDSGGGVRLTGQDSRRGTFSQRHAVVFDQANGAEHTPLAALASAPERLVFADTPLTEEACLAFEYGTSITDPNLLVCWEAQFGDFANGAQAVIDQFIAAGDSKWLRQSGLVLMLPHGLEGGGPEHSSARIERFLALAAEGNLSLVACSSPANLFHVLRRQLLRPWRAPLVLFTPKSGLRHAEAVSDLVELEAGTRFRPVIGDPAVARARRLILTSGKCAFDLLAERRERGDTDIAIVRLEELYPLPKAQLAEVIAAYRGAEVVWVQEEPENMGAWRYLRPHLEALSGAPVHLISRPEAASPAVGWGVWHKAEQRAILEAAFA
jgi:2-oxoglutarate dehydrogenase E1 component